MKKSQKANLKNNKKLSVLSALQKKKSKILGAVSQSGGLAQDLEQFLRKVYSSCKEREAVSI